MIKHILSTSILISSFASREPQRLPFTAVFKWDILDVKIDWGDQVVYCNNNVWNLKEITDMANGVYQYRHDPEIQLAFMFRDDKPSFSNMVQNAIRLPPTWWTDFPNECAIGILIIRMLYVAHLGAESPYLQSLNGDDLAVFLRLPWSLMLDIGDAGESWVTPFLIAWNYLSEVHYEKDASIGVRMAQDGEDTSGLSLQKFIWYHVREQNSKLETFFEENGHHVQDISVLKEAVPFDIPLTPAMTVMQNIVFGKITDPKDKAISLALAQILTSANSKDEFDVRNGITLAQLSLLQAHIEDNNSTLTFADIMAAPIGQLFALLWRRGLLGSFMSITRIPNAGVSEVVAQHINGLNDYVLPRWKAHSGFTADAHGSFDEMSFAPAKPQFLLQEIDNMQNKQNKSINTICEIGFHFGGSAVAWLSTFPDAHLHVFDYGGRLNNFGADYVKQSFPNRVSFHWGDSMQSLPKFVEEHADVRCDLIFLDGCKDYDCRHSDFKYIRKVSAEDAIMFIDDVDAHVGSDSFTPSETTLAMRDWVNDGTVTDIKCFEAFNYDIRYNFESSFTKQLKASGICVGTLANKEEQDQRELHEPVDLDKVFLSSENKGARDLVNM